MSFIQILGDDSVSKSRDPQVGLWDRCPYLPPTLWGRSWISFPGAGEILPRGQEKMKILVPHWMKIHLAEDVPGQLILRNTFWRLYWRFSLRDEQKAGCGGWHTP